MYEHDPNTNRRLVPYLPVPAERWTYAGGEVIDTQSGGVIARAYREDDSPFRPVTRDSNMRHIVDAVHAYKDMERARDDILIPLLLDLEALGFGMENGVNGGDLVDAMQAYYERLTRWNQGEPILVEEQA